MKTVAIIGAGAAGLIAAATLIENNEDQSIKVLLFEKNSYLGAKVLISGGGRCNVTTGIFDVKKLLENYPRGNKFVISAFYRFPPNKVIEWFEHYGTPLKIEKDQRVFPVSNKGYDVIKVFNNILKNKSEIFLNSQITNITKNNEKFSITTKNNQTFSADIVILTTGGNAYRHTGSTGDGYAFASSLGHTITPLAASLHSFVVEENWIKELAGISIQSGTITLTSFDYQRKFKRTGPFLFTHKGITGPAVFALSSMAAYEDYEKTKPQLIEINFISDKNQEELKKNFQIKADLNGKKTILNFLDIFIPKSIGKIILELAGINHEIIVSRINKQQRDILTKLLQNFPLHVIARGAGDEFVTAGGVNTNEVNSNTMESKICKNLYFAGEVLDIDGFTGGFNLQAAWATGKLAAENIIKNLHLNIKSSVIL